MMTVRAADLRFLSPSPPRTAALLGGWAEAADAFRAAGVEVVTAAGGGEVDLVAGVRGDSSRTAWRPKATIDRGWPSRGARHGGWPGRRYLVTSGPEGPALAVDAASAARRFVAATWSRPTSVAGRVRNLAVRHLGGVAASVAVTAPGSTMPYPLSAATAALGLPAPTSWVVQFGRGDDLQRVVALAFAEEPSPSWVLKFSRVPGAPARGAVEQVVLRELEERAPAIAARATRVLGRLDIGGSDATVEPAAAGASMSAFLRTAPARQREGLACRVIEWAIGLASLTARPGGPRGAVVGPGEALAGVGSEHLAVVRRAARVVAHNDLGTWNVLTDGRGFTVVDWESGSVAGFPIWDVAYLVTDVLCELHGPRPDTERVQWCAALWRGELAVSGQLALHLRRAASSAHVAEDELVALVVSCWAHHAASQGRRSRQLGRSAAAGYLGSFGSWWSGDPGLGPRWPGLSPA